MSETLRDLVVSLSLQTDNFTRNIKSVSKQIAEAESQFKLAAAGVEGFERTATGLATQLSTLERRLSLQKDAVNQYQRALEAANNKLSECYNRQNDYAQRLENAKVAMVPGDVFGSEGDHYIRMSFANSYENVVEGCKRLKEFVEKIRK